MLKNQSNPNEREPVQGKNDQSKNPNKKSRKDKPLDKDLVEKIKKENELLTDISGNVTTNDRFGQEAIDALEPPTTRETIITDDHSLTKNQLGDNPPGSEEKAFEEGYIGDMSKDVAKYPDENLIENFRENLDKTDAEIRLDKKLKVRNKGTEG